MDQTNPTFWKKCSSCKKEILFGSQYYLCSVSTCRHSRTGYRFCSVPCWDEHLGFANHREAWAEEAKSPSRNEYERTMLAEANEGVPRAPVRKIVGEERQPTVTSQQTAPSLALANQIKTDPLVVVSKVKKLISDQSGMNTSQCCVDALTRKVVAECLKGIEHARSVGRKTVMGRDIT